MTIKTHTRQAEVAYRSAQIQTRSIDEDKRTVEIAFSSETPVPRWGELEVLDHDPESVRMERINSGGPLLLDHDWNNQVGVVDEIRIDADRVGRAVVRFSKSQRASDVFQDVIDGIRQSISVGYRVYKAVVTEISDEGPDTVRITDWEPLEISIVSVPADITVGVGRSANADPNILTIEQEVTTMEDDNTPAQRVELSADDKARIEKQAQDSARDAELKRLNSIRKIGANYKGHDKLVDEAIRNGTDVDTFVDQLADAEIDKRSKDVPDTHLDLSDKDLNRYSVSRALLAQATGDWREAEFEREASQAIAERLDIEPKGVLVPYDVQSRVITTTGAASGAIGTDHMAGSFIDNLRDNSLLASMGMVILSGLRGNIDIPRKTSSAAYAWVGEDGDSPESDINVGVISMSPKTATASVPMSRRTLKQATPDIDTLVMNDLSVGAALALDLAALVGTGGTQPLGITQTTGVLVNALATAGQMTWEELVNFETLCVSANSLAQNHALITTPSVRGALKTTKKDAGSGIFLVENNEANGYPVHVKTDPGFGVGRSIFGDFSQLIAGMWGVLDLVADPATKAASGGLVIRAFIDVDNGVRQPSAFVING